MKSEVDESGYGRYEAGGALFIGIMVVVVGDKLVVIHTDHH